MFFAWLETVLHAGCCQAQVSTVQSSDKADYRFLRRVVSKLFVNNGINPLSISA
jgi:hypothetical protein